MKKSLILLALMPVALQAQTISTKDAQNRALQFLQTQTQTRGAEKDLQLSLAYTSKDGDETYYYVFNNSAGGYVIMGGDEAAQEVLGYGETGCFDYSLIPDNMRWWLSQYDAQISQAIKEVKAGTNKVVRQAQTRAERADIPVMLTTTWGQKSPYNSQLPTSLNGVADFPTGCGVTAAAQIMNYYRWPETGVGSKTLEKVYWGNIFTADFENTQYDWDAMKDSYETNYTDSPEEIAVGTLMYHLGVAFEASYWLDGTITDRLMVPKRLAEHFRYNKGMSLLFRIFFNDTDWEAIVYDELSAKRPVFYTGVTENSIGHAFVCDGYKEGLWHINWGWDGMYNNYFLLTPTSTEKALQPGGTGTGGGEDNDSYAIQQGIVTGMCPDPDGNTQYKKTLSINSYNIDENLLAVGDTLTMTMGFQNIGLDAETFEIRYKLVNSEDADDYFILEDSISLTLKSLISQEIDVTFCVTDNYKKGSVYKIIPLFKDENGEWQQTLVNLETDYAFIKISYDFDLIDSISVSNKGNVCKDVFDVSFSLKNFTKSTLTYPIYVLVFSEEDDKPEIVDYFDLGEITLASGNEREFNVGAEHLQYGDRMVAGKEYKIQVGNYADGSLLGAASTCSYYDTRIISLTIPEMGWATLAIPFDAEIPEGLKAYSVKIDFDDDDLIILSKKDCILRNNAYLIHGVPGTYQFVGPAIDLEHAYLDYLFAHEIEGPLDPEYNFVLDIRDGIVGFYRVDETTTIGQYEAYLFSYSSKDVVVFTAPDGDDPTAIQNITIKDFPVRSTYFDLNGRGVSADTKGFIVVDGKILLIK